MSDRFIEENNVKIHKTENVFYNPAQKFNRDLTISVINEYIKNIKNPKIFEAMSATGLRGIRFIKEIEGDCTITMNDYDAVAVKHIFENLKCNNIIDNEASMFESPETSIKYNGTYIDSINTKNIVLLQGDCNLALYKNKSKFDVIDIDPFGCCTPYIESAIANIKHNGLLCVTSTDTGVLCSNKKKCYIKYNAIIARTPAHHEQAIRIVLGYIAKCAGKYGKSITPVITLSVDFYIRIYMIVSNNNKNKTFEDVSYYLHCDCLNTKEISITKNKTSSKCDNCGNENMTLIGPLYNKTIKDNAFIDRMNITITRRVQTMLTILRNELDTFLFFAVPDLSHYLKKSCMPTKYLLNALHNLNYCVSFTHCKNNSIKTNASINVLYGIINSYFDDKSNVIFISHGKTKELMNRDYKLDVLSSGMGPLSMPKK